MTTETMPSAAVPAGEETPDRALFSGTSLYDRLCGREVLREAWQFVQEHPLGIFPAGVPLETGDERSGGFLEKLEEELRSRTYRPGPVFRVCRVRRRARNECVRVLQPRDRVVCVALLLTVKPVLEAADRSAGTAARVLAVIQATLRSGWYRVVPPGGKEVLSRDTLGELLRRVTAVVHDEAVRDLIKRLMRAPLVEDIRLAG